MEGSRKRKRFFAALCYNLRKPKFNEENIMSTAVSELIKKYGCDNLEVTLEPKLTLSCQDERYKTMGMQGGGTDGKYGYFVMNEHGSTEAVKSKIIKVDLDKWEIVTEAHDFYMCHANDVAYDAKHHRLLVSHCNVDSHKMSIIDPDSLELIEVKSISTRHFAMAYNAKRNQYVVGKTATYDIAVLDEDFNPLYDFEGEDGHVKQGIECDDDFIYFFQTGCRYNWIFIYDWDGKYYGKIKVPMVGESEHLFFRGEDLIGTFNVHKDRTAPIYVMKVSPKE